MKTSIQQNLPAILTVTILVGLGGAVVWDQTSNKKDITSEVVSGTEQVVDTQSSDPAETASAQTEPAAAESSTVQKESAAAEITKVAEAASEVKKPAKPVIEKLPEASTTPKESKVTKATVQPGVQPQVATVTSNYPTLQGNTNALAQALEPINESEGAINFGCFIIGESCPSDKPNCGVEELMSTPSFFPFMNVGIAMMRTMGNAMINQTAMGIPVTGALNVMFKMTPRVKVPPPYVYKYQPKPWPWTQPKS